MSKSKNKPKFDPSMNALLRGLAVSASTTTPKAGAFGSADAPAEGGEASAPRYVTRGANHRKAEEVVSKLVASPTAAAALPPVTFKREALQIGWIRGTVPFERYRDLSLLLSSVFKSDPEITSGMWGYDSRLLWSNGVFVAADLDDDGRCAKYCSVDIQGGVLEEMTPARVLGLLHDLRDLSIKPTRIDVSGDDYEWCTTPAEINAAGRAEKVVGFRSRGFHDSGIVGEESGDTATFGKRGKNGSGRFYRFYDKNAESGGVIDALRIELEASDSVAEQIYAHLAAAENVEQLAARIGEAVAGGIDFVEPGTARYHKDCTRLDWWQRIVTALGQAKFTAIRVASTLETTKAWIVKAVSGAMAKVESYMALKDEDWHAFLNECMCKGRGKLKKADIARIVWEAVGERGREVIPL